MMSGTRSSVAVPVNYLAGILMMVAGSFGFLEGLAAVVKEQYYVVGPNYIYEFNVTTWGWIHLILGLGLGLAGFFVLRGALWARIVGVGAAALVGVANFMWLPYQPVWSVTIIALCVLIIWALTVHGREMAAEF
jgi:hypothetical protein